MKTAKIFASIFLTALVLFGMIHPAQALNMYASAQAGGAPISEDFYTPGETGVFAEAWDSSMGDGATGAANQGGGIAASAYPSGGLARADVLWAETYTNNTGVAQNYTWDFFIPTGRLSIYDWFGSLAPVMGAAYSLEILLDGGRVWYSSASVQGNAASGFTYSTVGTVLAGDIWDNGESFEALYNPYDGLLDLGTFGAGESFDIEYRMSVEAFGGAFFGELGPSATFGDPFGLDYDPQAGMSGQLSGQPAQSVVPEPGTIFLLGSGLLGLVWLRRKLKK